MAERLCRPGRGVVLRPERVFDWRHSDSPRRRGTLAKFGQCLGFLAATMVQDAPELLFVFGAASLVAHLGVGFSRSSAHELGMPILCPEFPVSARVLLSRNV